MKKVITLLLSVFFLAVFLNYSPIMEKITGRIMGIPVSSAEQIDRLLAGKNEEMISSKITLNGKKAPYDKNSNTVFIPQNPDNDSWEGKLKTESGHIYLSRDELLSDKSSAISTGHIFQLYLINENTYSVCNMVFTGMPIINITLPDSGSRDINLGVDGLLDVTDPYRIADSIKNIPCTYALRGASARGYEKSSYKLTLDNKKVSLLGMRRDDDWILNALYDDFGLIHNKFSYVVWREIAQNNTVANDEGTTMEVPFLMN